MLTLNALRKVASKVCGVSESSVVGMTKAKVLDYIGDHFQKSEITKMELSIGEGADAGKLILTMKLNTGVEKTAKVALPE